MGGGDLGRRVAERRAELGLSVEDVAARTGMSPTYLQVVEASPSAHLSPSALWALAAALDTSMAAILGGGFEKPPGRTGAAGRAVLDVLDEAECRRLIAPGGVGRLVYPGAEGPVVVPVNYGVLGENVVFRTEPDAKVLGLPPEAEVSFEVDHLDDALSEGWSVLLTGQARVMVEPAELDRARALGLSPWAGGDRPTYVGVTPRRITGRRIRHRTGSGYGADGRIGRYPSELEGEVTTADGARFHVRPIRPDDGDRLAEFHNHLSEASVYRRFFYLHRTLSAGEVERFTRVDYVSRLALIVEDGPQLVAVGRYERLLPSDEAEVAFVVADLYQHRGIATELLDRLARAALDRGIRTLVARTLPDNRDMLDVFMRCGYPVGTTSVGGTVQVRIRIGEGPRSPATGCGSDRREAGQPGSAG